MSEDIILIILSAGGVIGVIPIFLNSLSQLIENLVNLGFMPEHWEVSKKSIRLQNKRAVYLLRALQIPDEYLHKLRGTLIKGLSKPIKQNEALSLRLLKRLRSCIRKLDGQNFYYDETKEFYVDSMGDMYHSSQEDLDLSSFLHEWFRHLYNKDVIETPDCILANKEGNVSIVQRLRARISPTDNPDIGLIVTKSRNDRSRVKRSDPIIPHRTDFEGLEAFLLQRAERNVADIKYNVVFVDDNCTGAKNMCDAIESFNNLIQRESLPFNPVKHAIVLFTIKTQARTKNRCDAVGVKLHSVLSLGHNELHSLAYDKNKDIKKKIEMFKSGFECEYSE